MTLLFINIIIATLLNKIEHISFKVYVEFHYILIRLFRLSGENRQQFSYIKPLLKYLYPVLNSELLTGTLNGGGCG